MTPINCIEDLKAAINHPYRIGEYLTDETQIFEVDEDMNVNEALIDTYEDGELFYCINWEDDDLYTEQGVKIESVY